ncbi:hypothetical protein BaRGS_00009052, partial [Batillaria attramentaria]
TCGRKQNSDDGLSTQQGPCLVDEEYSQLQACLRDLHLPATVDRTRTPRTRANSQHDVTIVLIAELEEGMPPFFEGNRQCPGGALLVLTLSWLSREPSSHDPNMSALYVHKAITADGGGQSYLDIFSPPRRATYVVNHLTGSITSGRRREGEVMTSWNLDCPLASSIPLSKRVDNKLLSRLACAEIGLPAPVTLGLWLQGDMVEELSERFPSITVLRLPSSEISSDWLEPHVLRFVNSDVMKPYNKVVVKPFGSPWNSSQNVTYHTKTVPSTIVRAVLDLVGQIDPGDGILIESFMETVEPTVSCNDGRHSVNVEGIELGMRIRVFVSRTPQNGARVTQIVCGIGDGREPIAGLYTVPITLELMLHKWGTRDPAQKTEIRKMLTSWSEKLLLHIMEQETKLSVEEKGGLMAQTETIGIDYVFTKLKNVLTPVVIEVNAQDCLWSGSVFEYIHPKCRGQTARTWVQTMVARSQRFLMKDKTVLVVGAGGFSKRKLWKGAKELGVKIVLVDQDPDHFAKTDVYLFLHVDITDHTKDEQHADTIIKLLQSEVGQVDGCLAMWEYCVPLASLVAEGLQLRYTIPYAAAMAGKDKQLTQKTLREDAFDPPHIFPARLFSSPVALVSGPEALEEAVTQVPLPAVLKREYGSCAVAMMHVQGLPEAIAHVQHVQATLRTEDDFPGVGLGHGHSFVLMPRLMGTEHDIDVVMFEGQLMAAFVSDNGPTHFPHCNETAAAMPSVLDEESERVLIAAAEVCCRHLGLTTGVFNVEMMMTPRGPRLIEINARMGGFYLRDWIRRVYHVDIFHMAIMAACGVRPVATSSAVGGSTSSIIRDHAGQLMGMMLYKSRHAKALATTASLDVLHELHEQGAIVFFQMAPNVEDGKHEYEEPFANLAVHAPTLEEARAKLVGICVALGLETEVSMAYILQDFVHS